MIVQPFNLNLIPEQSPTVIHVDQYDHGTGRLLISLFDGDTPYTPSGTAVIQGTKPDGKGFQYVCTLSGNKVTANLTDQMTAVAGRVRTQIVVTETSGRTGAFAFVLDVQKSALPSNTDMSESDYQLIEEAIEEVQASAADAEGYAQNAEAWAQGTRDGEPVSPTDPTYNHNAEYWARYAEEYSQGGMHYKASILASAIPVAGMHVGDMYNIENSFTTDSRFQEGAGIEVDAGTNIVYNTNDKWDLLAMPIIPTMTASVLGIGSPDGMTSDVNNGIFRAKGVAIYCTVNPSGTEHGANWLKYGDTVITPSNIQLYLVYIDGDPTLWAWNGTSYVMVSASGAGGLVSILQADFDLLPTADKNDPDIWWWISDADGVVSTTGSGGGTSDYTDLSNKPSINGVTLIGNQTSSTLHIGGEGTSDYTALINKPQINGHTLTGNMSSSTLGIGGALVSLDDVNISSAKRSQALVYNPTSNKWVNGVAHEMPNYYVQITEAPTYSNPIVINGLDISKPFYLALENVSSTTSIQLVISKSSDEETRQQQHKFWISDGTNTYYIRTYRVYNQGRKSSLTITLQRQPRATAIYNDSPDQSIRTFLITPSPNAVGCYDAVDITIDKDTDPYKSQALTVYSTEKGIFGDNLVEIYLDIEYSRTGVDGKWYPGDSSLIVTAQSNGSTGANIGGGVYLALYNGYNSQNYVQFKIVTIKTDGTPPTIQVYYDNGTPKIQLTATNASYSIAGTVYSLGW
jgi:hypothetical protein